jgi:hypothetical protein
LDTLGRRGANVTLLNPIARLASQNSTTGAQRNRGRLGRRNDRDRLLNLITFVFMAAVFRLETRLGLNQSLHVTIPVHALHSQQRPGRTEVAITMPRQRSHGCLLPGMRKGRSAGAFINLRSSD